MIPEIPGARGVIVIEGERGEAGHRIWNEYIRDLLTSQGLRPEFLVAHIPSLVERLRVGVNTYRGVLIHGSEVAGEIDNLVDALHKAAPCIPISIIEQDLTRGAPWLVGKI